jgi:hypothetical protein
LVGLFTKGKRKHHADSVHSRQSAGLARRLQRDKTSRLLNQQRSSVMVNTGQRGGMQRAEGKKHQGVRPGSTGTRKERGNKEPRQKLVPDSKFKKK